MNRRVKFYTDLLKDYNMSSSVFNYIKDKSPDIKTDKGRVSFDFFVEEDKRRGQNYTHLFFNTNSSYIAISHYLKQNEPKLLKTNVFVYLSKRKNRTVRMIERINETIKPTQIDYVEDILKEISTKKYGMFFEKITYDTPKVFISTSISEEYNSSVNEDSDTEDSIKNVKKADYNYVKSWYDQENSPVLVILGKAGIGKTTIAQYFSNVITRENPNTTNIFINSVEVKRRLIDDYKENSRINLYNIYKSSVEQQRYLDENYFKYNLDTGNIFVIIDGIDELISKVDNFEVSDFLDSVNEYNQQIKNSKIIITCRNEYWKEGGDNVITINLLPFDTKQTEYFFEHTYTEELSRRKFDKSIELAKDFHKNLNRDQQSSNNIYHPFALDLITKVVNNDAQIKDVIDAKILNTKEVNDYIIAKMCYREDYLTGKSRITNLSIDKQVKVFQYIAIVFNGIVDYKDLKYALYFGINKNIENEQDFDTSKLTKSLSSHPLLIERDGYIRFAYDFLSDFFKATYLAYYLGYEDLSETSNDFLKILFDCSFGNQLVKDIAARVKRWDEQEFLNLQLLIDNIENSNYELRKQIKFYSGVFNLAFEINKKFNGNKVNKMENTILLEKLYGVKRIKNLCLLNISEKVEFNFSQVEIFQNCHFYKYSSFWDNKAASKNKFLNCSFSEIGPRNTKNPMVWVLDTEFTNFDFNSQSSFGKHKNLGMDSEFMEQFKRSEGRDLVIKEEVKSFVLKFIKFFWHRNHLQPQNFDIVDNSCKYPLQDRYSSFGDLVLSFEEFVDILDSLNFIERIDYHGIKNKKVNISKDIRPEITDYLTQGSFSMNLNQLVEKIYFEIR